LSAMPVKMQFLKRLIALIALLAQAGLLHAQSPVGTHGIVGTLANPKTVNRLEITKPGIYENYLVDAQGGGGNIVKVTADNVTIKNLEIRNGSGNGIGVFGNNVIIENCRIHHLLQGTFKDQQDAHGITGRWSGVVIRNCDISQTSGDCIQFDPDRASHGTVTIEDCALWSGPLTADAAGFKAGERPGENAVDTKTKPAGDRCRLIIRNCYIHGWNQPAQVDNAAALNLKENVDAEVTHCVFQNNEIAFRLRGPSSRGGAHVTIKDCAIYETQFGIRAEDKIENLKISGLAFGTDVAERIRFVNGKELPGYEHTGDRDAPALELLLKSGFSPR